MGADDGGYSMAVGEAKMPFNTFTLTYYEVYPYYVGCKVPNPVTDDEGKTVIFREPGKVVRIESKQHFDDIKFTIVVAYGYDD